ncbi:MAG: hypothetical protein AB7E47_06375 [Desulfovibrionaceae bacterium]
MKKHFSFEQHLEHGEALQRALIFITHLSTELGNTYGSTSKSFLASQNVLKTIQKFKSELDSLVFIENKEMTCNENASVYYAMNRIKENKDSVSNDNQTDSNKELIYISTSCKYGHENAIPIPNPAAIDNATEEIHIITQCNCGYPINLCMKKNTDGKWYIEHAL